MVLTKRAGRRGKEGRQKKRTWEEKQHGEAAGAGEAPF